MQSGESFGNGRFISCTKYSCAVIIRSMEKITAKHLTGIADLSDQDIDIILERAKYYAESLKTGEYDREKLKDKVFFTLFFENSTRTRTSFVAAAYRLGAKVVQWDAKTSSINKGETFEDTVRTLGAMSPDAVIIRHSVSEAPLAVREILKTIPVINAGDAAREHPSQALLDALTLKDHFGTLEGLTVSIIGDIAHSRVAGSNAILLSRKGANVRIIAPPSLMPEEFPVNGVESFTDVEKGLEGADAVMTIRPQKERMQTAFIDDNEYFEGYGMTHERLDIAGKDAVLLDPGPFLRGLQITNELADDRSRFLYDKQVANGVPARMAIFDCLLEDR